jgi:FKBP-type peptidyl-prolyl cis-trans isomerase FklB
MTSGLRVAALSSLLLSLACAGDGAPSGESAALETNDQKAAYGIGMNMGTQLRAANERLDRAAFMRGFEDGLQAAESQVPEPEIQAALMEFGSQLEAAENAARVAEGEENLAAGAAYLEQNRAKPGVTTTASGLQYEVLRAGDGERPSAESVVRIHYRGTLIDGTEFDSSYSRGEPAEFPVNAVIPGWTEALQKMKVGDKWQLVVPADLAYGLNPPGPPIEPNSLLIFEVELLGINGQ